VELVAAQALVPPLHRRVRGRPRARWRKAAYLLFGPGRGRLVVLLARGIACRHGGAPRHVPPGGDEPVVDVVRAEHQLRSRRRHFVARVERVGRRRRQRRRRWRERWRRWQRRRRRRDRWRRRQRRRQRRRRGRRGRRDGRRQSRRGRQQGLEDERGCAAVAHADDREESDEDAEQVGLAGAARAAARRVERGLLGPLLGREGRARGRVGRRVGAVGRLAARLAAVAPGPLLRAGEGPKLVGAARNRGGVGVRERLQERSRRRARLVLRGLRRLQVFLFAAICWSIVGEGCLVGRDHHSLTLKMHLRAPS